MNSNNEYQNLVRMITNKNSVTYSNISKRSEGLESGGLTLTTNNIEKSFLFKSGVDVVKIGVEGSIMDLFNRHHVLTK